MVTCKKDAFNLISEMRDLLFGRRFERDLDPVLIGLSDLETYLKALGQVGFWDVTNYNDLGRDISLMEIQCRQCFKKFTRKWQKEEPLVCPSCGQKKIG